MAPGSQGATSANREFETRWEEIMVERPRRLGLLPDEAKGMSASTLEKLDVLAGLDLAMARKSFLARHQDEKPYIDALERELKRFLSLPLFVPNPSGRFAPSLLVDELWHDLILNTAQYRRMCDAVYGAYLDHTPNQEELDEASAGAVVDFTHSALNKYYGSLDLSIWGSDIAVPCYPPPPAPARSPQRPDGQG
ncbi:MAG TPA: hypothetical protein VH458_03310 [Vicinamibacterales bacterium]